MPSPRSVTTTPGRPRSTRRGRVAEALLAAAAAGALAGCGGGLAPSLDDGPDGASASAVAVRTIESNDGAWTVAWRPLPGPIRLDQAFDVEVVIRTADGAPPLPGTSVLVDCRMPHHRHGMTVEPTIVALGDGRWRAKGMLLHMLGYWELYVDVERDGTFERAQDSFELDA